MEQKGDLVTAMADINKAIELDPTNANAYNGRGWVEFIKKDFDSSISDANHAIQLDPQNGDAFGTRGWARYCKGDVPGAVEDCKAAVKFHQPNSTEYFFDQGMLDFIAGDYEKAIVGWQKAIHLNASLKSELQPWIDKAQAKLQEKKTK
jgi:tetratricopeptide (TPR) repeat protein